MSSVQERKPQTDTQKEEPNLKGTFISVMLIGLFIIVSWAGVFALFIGR
ncbi:cytochrome c oxidase subunit 2A [Virgibacillus sp. C22-A2]|uniref:Cytochrome c oxidase subunit 2A n=1 Tax=Virgibacillus tibetensis TaxID=3042313 RepID=A0ABU6KBF3_9BACI|nr:cytochrome c oxidase subunit 2A [Virgibacillus sp. C22-A2]